MNTLRFTLASVVILIGAAFAPSESRSQADPSWLKSWNEAEESRPLSITSSGRIATETEPGIPFVVHGQVFQPDGTPADRVVVHAYHRDRDGFDFGSNDNSLTTWRLQGWAKTDSEGRFEFQTIRPAPDHLGREGAHIHFTLVSDDFGRQWAPTVYLADDPMVTPTQHRRSKEAGQFGWVHEVIVADGVQHIDVRIRLREKPDF